MNRYSASKVYYGIFRANGKVVWKSLKTTDREIAARVLREELEKIGKVDPRNEKMTFEELLSLYEQSLEKFDAKTHATRKSILKILKAGWKNGFDIAVRDITPAQLELGLAPHTQGMKKVSFNEYIRVVRHIFELAVNSKVIAVSPAGSFKMLRPETPDRITPTWEQA